MQRNGSSRDGYYIYERKQKEQRDAIVKRGIINDEAVKAKRAVTRRVCREQSDAAAESSAIKDSDYNRLIECRTAGNEPCKRG